MLQKGFSAIVLILIVLVVIVVAGGVYINGKDNPDQIFQRPKAEKTATTSLSNPASEYCIKVGGTLESQTRGDGGEYAVCNFEDNQSCEEWALYRRNCPIGGIKTTGYDTPEEIYCVLTGGKTTATPNSSCTLPGGNVCSNSDLYNGKCQ